MAFGERIGTIARRVDRRFGIQAWLRGEPRPPAGGFDLSGEKLLDWGWICVNLPRGHNKALDVGCGESPVIPAMLALGYEVMGVDLEGRLARSVANFTMVKGDFNQLDLNCEFDLVIACSSIEHFGLSGRFGSPEDPSGDLKAMQKISRLLAPGGLLFLTVPMGRDAVHKPWHRVYGRKRLPQLLQGFEVVHQRFLSKEPWGPWQEVGQEVALDYPAQVRCYALGQLILRKPT